MTSINGAINDLVRSLGYESRIKEQKAIMIWEKVVGKRIAAVTNPLSIKKGILKIKVKNPPWRQELTYMKEDIIKKLNDEIGDILVSDIKFS
ncbi:MAG: DUF721 domain-containing protein [Candidatus Hatepunaea meridiana]|nr:DUF721 domain-containing protein [Candidatus Hatepunaea meridiana]